MAALGKDGKDGNDGKRCIMERAMFSSLFDDTNRSKKLSDKLSEMHEAFELEAQQTLYRL